jgi:hypothetical protein
MISSAIASDASPKGVGFGIGCTDIICESDTGIRDSTSVTDPAPGAPAGTVGIVDGVSGGSAGTVGIADGVSGGSAGTVGIVDGVSGGSAGTVDETTDVSDETAGSPTMCDAFAPGRGAGLPDPGFPSLMISPRVLGNMLLEAFGSHRIVGCGIWNAVR